MIQIDIDMPTDCASCWIRQNMGCKIANASGWLNNRRDDKCPLKEQEPIEPVDDGHGSLICGNQGYECGCVGRYDLTTKVVEKYCNFCPECGRKVKWE